MSEVKWIKLSVNVFDDEKFDAIKTLPDSNDMQLVWVKLLCLAGKCNESGLLMISREIPYTDEMLAQRFSMDIGVVQRALSLFQSLGMIDLIDNVYMVSNWTKYQTLDTYEKAKERDRLRKREERAKKKELLEDKKTKTSTDASTDSPRTVQGFCSLSISSFSINNSNVKNLIYLIDNNIYKDSEYIKDNEELYGSIIEWMEYKDARTPKTTHHYDTEKGISKLLTQVVNHDKEYGTQAVIAEIDLAISNNWHGIQWNNLERYGKKIQRQEKPKQKSLFDDLQ